MSKYPLLTAYIADFNLYTKALQRPQIKLLLDQSGIDRLVDDINMTIQTANPLCCGGEADWSDIKLAIDTGKELRQYVTATEYNMPELLVLERVLAGEKDFTEFNDELPNKLWPVQPECYEGCDDPYCPYMH
jgi:hypothetical protein